MKMEELELKHLAPYLPYGLQIANKSIKKSEGILSIYKMEINNENDNGIENVLLGVNQMLILRPLSDLTKEIEHNGEKFVPNEFLKQNYTSEMVGVNVSTWSHRVVEKLSEWHFDWQGLIKKGLAIDVNELNKLTDER